MGGDVLAHRIGEHIGAGQDGAAEEYGDIRDGPRGGLQRCTRQHRHVAPGAEPHEGVDAGDDSLVDHQANL